MSRLRWPDSTNSVSEKPGTIHLFKREKISGLLVPFLWNGLATIRDVGSKR